MNIEFVNTAEEDNSFIFQLFCSHKNTELASEAWPEDLKLQITSMQFRAFQESIPCTQDVNDLIIQQNTINLGRLIYSETKDGLLIRYLALLPEFQDRGFGKEVIHFMKQKAVEYSKNISLHVSKANPAFILYRKMGFKVQSEDDLGYEMLCRA